jgi:hypothetical protein
LILDITHKKESEIDQMTFSEFENKYEISAIISNYKRGEKLELMTEKDKDARIRRKIKKFQQKGLL